MTEPEADPEVTQVVVDLLVTAGRLLDRMDALLRPHGLTTSAFNVLHILAGDPDPLTPTEVARRLPVPVTTATVTGLLDTLQRKGLLQRRPHPEDRRRVLVVLTDEGRALLGRLAPEVAAAERRWTAALPLSSRPRLLRALAQVRESLDESP